MSNERLFNPDPPSGTAWYFNRIPVVSRPDPRFALTMELGARVALAIYTAEQERPC